MRQESGSPTAPIWLLADSEPAEWRDQLCGPLDPRHPVRHNIWTPVYDAIQNVVFVRGRRRLDGRTLYVRNAVVSARVKPSAWSVTWAGELAEELEEFARLVAAHQPRIILSFGAFSFEFGRRTLGEQPKSYNSWGGGRARRRVPTSRRRVRPGRDYSAPFAPPLHLRRRLLGGPSAVLWSCCTRESELLRVHGPSTCGTAPR